MQMWCYLCSDQFEMLQTFKLFSLEIEKEIKVTQKTIHRNISGFGLGIRLEWTRDFSSEQVLFSLQSRMTHLYKLQVIGCLAQEAEHFSV